MSFILNGINTYSGYGFAHPACRTPANTTITGLLECLIYCHGILNNTTLNQGNYFKAKEMCWWTPDQELYYFHDASVAARSSCPLLEQETHLSFILAPSALQKESSHLKPNSCYLLLINTRGKGCCTMTFSLVWRRDWTLELHLIPWSSCEYHVGFSSFKTFPSFGEFSLHQSASLGNDTCVIFHKSCMPAPCRLAFFFFF